MKICSHAQYTAIYRVYSPILHLKKFIFVFQCKNIKISYCMTNFFLNFLHLFFLFQFLCTLKSLYFALMRVRQAYKPRCNYMCASGRKKKGEKRREEKAWIFVKQIGQMFKYIYFFSCIFLPHNFDKFEQEFFHSNGNLPHATCQQYSLPLHAACNMCVCIYHLDSNYPVYRL